MKVLIIAGYLLVGVSADCFAQAACSATNDMKSVTCSVACNTGDRAVCVNSVGGSAPGCVCEKASGNLIVPIASGVPASAATTSSATPPAPVVSGVSAGGGVKGFFSRLFGRSEAAETEHVYGLPNTPTAAAEARR